jgi:hypothetical protein
MRVLAAGVRAARAFRRCDFVAGLSMAGGGHAAELKQHTRLRRRRSRGVEVLAQMGRVETSLVLPWRRSCFHLIRRVLHHALLGCLASRSSARRDSALVRCGPCRVRLGRPSARPKLRTTRDEVDGDSGPVYSRCGARHPLKTFLCSQLRGIESARLCHVRSALATNGIGIWRASQGGMARRDTDGGDDLLSNAHFATPQWATTDALI